MASSYQDLNADLIDKAEGSGYPNRGGRSNRGADRRGRGGRGGSGRASIGRDVLISKALSRLLRHQADAEGLKLDREGFAKLDEVVSSSLELILGNLLAIQGFSIKEVRWICAAIRYSLSKVGLKPNDNIYGMELSRAL